MRTTHTTRAALPKRSRRCHVLAALLMCGALLPPAALKADSVAVRFSEGLVHGFLVLRTVDGTRVADGDLIQTARGDRVTSRLIFRFKDGSLRDERAVFSQRGQFRLISDRVIQKGPTFPYPSDMSIDCANNHVTVRYTDEDGKEQLVDEQLELPPDLTNGMILTLLKNFRAKALPESLSMVRVPKILTPILPEILAPPAVAGGAKNPLRPRTAGARGEDVGHAETT